MGVHPLQFAGFHFQSCRNTFRGEEFLQDLCLDDVGGCIEFDAIKVFSHPCEP